MREMTSAGAREGDGERDGYDQWSKVRSGVLQDMAPVTFVALCNRSASNGRPPVRAQDHLYSTERPTTETRKTGSGVRPWPPVSMAESGTCQQAHATPRTSAA